MPFRPILKKKCVRGTVSPFANDLSLLYYFKQEAKELQKRFVELAREAVCAWKTKHGRSSGAILLSSFTFSVLVLQAAMKVHFSTHSFVS